jgi:hypothetical protein
MSCDGCVCVCCAVYVAVLCCVVRCIVGDGGKTARLAESCPLDVRVVLAHVVQLGNQHERGTGYEVASR